MKSSIAEPNAGPANEDPPVLQPPIVVETSVGSIRLSEQELTLLSRIQVGEASSAEGQAFYQAVVACNAAFPLEWELLILRTSVASFPEREDLLQRLAFVEEAVSSVPPGEDTTSRLTFEQTWNRISRADLITPRDSTEHARVRKLAIDDACTVLSSPVFTLQPMARKVTIIIALHDTLMSVPSPDLPTVADLGLRQFSAMLRDPALTESQACAVYDALHSLYFAGASDIRDLRRFDAAVPPFELWLEQRYGRHKPPPMTLPAARPLTIAYLLHTAHANRGNAVSPLIGSLAEMHSAQPGRRILLYAVQYVGSDFIERMRSRGVTVHSFPQGNRYDRIDEIAESLKSEGVDIVVTEQNRALAAALFVRRVAPRQLWIDTGFPFWTLRALDWTLSPSFPTGPVSGPRISPIDFRQTPDTLKSSVNPEAVAEVRSRFPSDAFVLGVFVRLIKLNRNYFEFLGRLLGADPRFHLIIAGPGDAGGVEEFLQRPEIAARTVFIPGNVDLNVFGPAVDLMCDTFPFIGGLACREVSAHGTPVLSMLGTPWDKLLRRDRNPKLLAASENEYIALARRMATDKAFRNDQRRIVLEKAAQYANPKQMIDDVEAAITASIEYDGNDPTPKPAVSRWKMRLRRIGTALGAVLDKPRSHG
jgi:hypothetical protein